jgi:PIN domain nuclease of toxin-antitoxin system
MAIVIDTHIIIWYIAEPEELSAAALTAMESATAAGEPIYLSAISIVELCYLTERNRIPAIVLETLLQTLAEPDSEIVIMPVDQVIGLAVQQVDRATVPEMPDRIIAATALHLGCPLVTRDRKIQAFNGITTIW